MDQLGLQVVLLDRPQRTADFAVLTAPDVPSALVELGCLSNPVEERLLQQHTYQQRLARGLVRSIEGYFYTKPVDFEQLKAQLRQLPTAAD